MVSQGYAKDVDEAVGLGQHMQKAGRIEFAARKFIGKKVFQTRYQFFRWCEGSSV